MVKRPRTQAIIEHRKLKRIEEKRQKVVKQQEEKHSVKVFPAIQGKPKILMLADVQGWGAWKRGEYIKRYLSDEFEFTMVDWKMFNSEKFKVSDKWDVFFPLLHILTRYKKVQKQSRVVRTLTTVTSRIMLKPSYGGDQSKRIKVFRNHTRNVDMMIVNNLLVKSDAEKHFHGPVRYAPRGVDPDVFKFIEYPNNKRFMVYYVGKNEPKKGLKSIIKPVCNKNIKKISLMINKRNFVNAISEEQMVKAYNKCNVYMVASTIDGTPNPALEAASCGRPIISNKIGNMPQFIVNGENGFLLNSLDKKLYEEYLLYLATHRSEAYEMGQKARETVLNGWTWDILLNKNQRNILRELLQLKEKVKKK